MLVLADDGHFREGGKNILIHHICGSMQIRLLKKLQELEYEEDNCEVNMFALVASFRFFVKHITKNISAEWV